MSATVAADTVELRDALGMTAGQAGHRIITVAGQPVMRWWVTWFDEDRRPVTQQIIDRGTFAPVETVGEAIEFARRSNCADDRGAPRVFRRALLAGGGPAGPEPFAGVPVRPNRWVDPIVHRRRAEWAAVVGTPGPPYVHLIGGDAL